MDSGTRQEKWFFYYLLSEALTCSCSVGLGVNKSSLIRRWWRFELRPQLLDTHTQVHSDPMRKWTGGTLQQAARGFLISCTASTDTSQGTRGPDRDRGGPSHLFCSHQPSAVCRAETVMKREQGACRVQAPPRLYYSFMSSVKITVQNQLQHRSVWWSSRRHHWGRSSGCVCVCVTRPSLINY